MRKLDAFMELYIPALERAIADHPSEYAYPVEMVPAVAAKMRAAFERRSYNKDSYAIKAVCRALKIPHTYKAISAWMDGGEAPTDGGGK